MGDAPIVTNRAELLAWPPSLAGELPHEGWILVHVKPRQDKMLAANLRNMGIAGLMFLERRVRVYKRQGAQESTLPLLPGYIFISDATRRWDEIYGTDRVVHLAEVRRPDILRQDLLDLIALVTRVPGPVTVRPELVPGMPVILQGGSLAGMRGVVLRRRGYTELVVNVQLLGHSVAVTCPAADAQMADDAVEAASP